MILKGSQRAGARNLAHHLMRVDDNEHVSLHEMRGFASDNLRDAFREVEAISKGTRCKQYLFSLSLSPPARENVPIEVFEAAIERIEDKLGLQGQPRAIVFHEKDGRRHGHCVWSRVNPETMTACHLPFFKNRLMEIGRDLYLEHGWKLPRGLESPSERNPTNFTLVEWQQAKRQGIDPRWLKQVLQEVGKARTTGVLSRTASRNAGCSWRAVTGAGWSFSTTPGMSGRCHACLTSKQRMFARVWVMARISRM